MTNTETIGSRLEHFLIHKKMSQRALSKALMVTPGFISLLINNKTAITGRVIDGLAKKFTELNINWLLDGSGEMIKGRELEIVSESAPVYTPDKITFEELPSLIRGMQSDIKDMQARIDHLEKQLLDGRRN